MPAVTDGRPALPAILTRGLALAAASAAVISAGLAGRGLPGIAGDAAGGVLYAALMYLLLALAALPFLRRAGTGHGETVRLAGTAFLISTLIELFQLTSWPARLGEAWAPLHLVFGSTFNAWDLPAYAAGATAAGVLDALVRRKTPGRTARP